MKNVKECKRERRTAECLAPIKKKNTDVRVSQSH